MKKHLIFALSASALILASCGSRNALPRDSGGDFSAPNLGVVGSTAGLVRNQPPAIAPMRGGAGSFEEWKSNLKARAAASGISAGTIAAAEPYMVYSSSVVSSDRNQAEFVKPIWGYLDSALGSRIGKGRAKASEWASTLSAIEARYGVDRGVLLGIWGMETNYGGFMGSTNVFTSMSSLAYEGRRRDFAETQLINAMYMVDQGERSASALNGSWGGGMGQTQFIPESFNRYAVDFTGDGRRDIWSVPDALASTANYLRNEGWIPGVPWGVEVQLPAGFDYSEASPTRFRSASYWRKQGVTPRSGSWPKADIAIFLPAGANGPALAITQNFFAIRSYNPSDSYALAVAQLGDAATGRPTIQASWPRGEQKLRRAQVQAAQQRLMAMGYDTGGADGMPGRATREAVRRYQMSQGLPADGYLTYSLYQRIVGG